MGVHGTSTCVALPRRNTDGESGGRATHDVARAAAECIGTLRERVGGGEAETRQRGSVGRQGMCDGAARDRQRGNAESHTSEGHRVERTGESRGWSAGRDGSTKGATGVDRDQGAVQAPETEGRGVNTQRSRTGNGNGLMMIKIKNANRIAQVTKCGGVVQEVSSINKLWKRLRQGQGSRQGVVWIVAGVPSEMGALDLGPN